MGFTLLRKHFLPVMQAELHEYEEAGCKARHVHLATDSPESVFLVAFPTLPEVGDGRAHILEHVTLCGSRRFPVRDPFFSMLRRSTAHFMNAMTYPDRTVYPFATTDRKDFFNLLDVYLDAAFFPCLDYLDFRQEGWRLAYEGDRLTYQGVVFNEMKGAFSSPQRAVDAGLQAELFAGTTYAVESGGDPLLIPSLTHEQLKAFHAEHYHPSQAVFMTAGRIDPREIQQVIEDQVLARWVPLESHPRLLPQLAQHWDAPRKIEVRVPGSEYAVQMAWRMGLTADPLAYYRAQLLDEGLLGSAAAPLMAAMESAGYGRPSDMNGLDPARRQLVFHLGMEGLDAQQVAEAEKRLRDALERTAQQGVPIEALQAALRDERFELRDVRAGHTPHLLERLLQALPHILYGGDVADGFEADAVLEQLQEQIADPAFFKGMVQALLENPTRVDAVVVPDEDYFSRRQAAETQQLVQLQAALGDEQKKTIQAEMRALQERQRKPVDSGMLPRIRPCDVSPELPQSIELPCAQNGVIVASIPSNGISHARLMFDVSDVEQSLWPWLQIYVDVLPELGMGKLSYEEADAWRHGVAPHFHINLLVAPQLSDPDAVRIYIDFYARGLREEQQGLAALLSRTLQEARFDEHERLAYLITSKVQDIRNMLADEGDDYARAAAHAPFSAASRFEDVTSGCASLPFLAALAAQAEHSDGIAAIARKLESLHQRILSVRPQALFAGMEQDGEALARQLALPGSVPAPHQPLPARVQPGAPARLALHAPAQSNHCFAAWSVPMMDSADAAALAVLGELVTNQLLHPSIREEGGAYGGQAYYLPYSGLFVMMSYRDPRLAGTYTDFERALPWLMEAALSEEQLEEAIIGVIQNLDRPRPAFAELMRMWHLGQQGVTREMLRDYRRNVLACTLEQVKAAAGRWLHSKSASRAAFVGEMNQDLFGLEPVRLATLAGTD